jgi:hypothetical protein
MDNWLSGQIQIWQFILTVLLVLGIVIGVYRYIYERRKNERYRLLKDCYNTFSTCFLQITKRVLEVDDIYEPKLIKDTLFSTTRPLANYAHSLDDLHKTLEDYGIRHREKPKETQMDFCFAMAKVFIYEASNIPEAHTLNEEIVLIWLERHGKIADEADSVLKTRLRYNPFLRGLFYANRVYNVLNNMSANSHWITCPYEAIRSDVDMALNYYSQADEISEKFNSDSKTWKHAQISRVGLLEKLYAVFGIQQLKDKYFKEYDDLEDDLPEFHERSIKDVAYTYLNIGERYLIEANLDKSRKILATAKKWCKRNQDQVERKTDLKYYEDAVIGLEYLCDLYEIHCKMNEIKSTDKKIIDRKGIDNKNDELKELGLLGKNSYYSEILDLLIRAMRVQYYLFSGNRPEAESTISDMKKIIEDHAKEWYFTSKSKPALLLKMVEEAIQRYNKNKDDFYIR